MTPVFVWAVVTDERGVLLVPAREADGWLLPGGPLRDDDETVEAAIVREVERHFGVRLREEPPFLDTQYERRHDGRTVVHNLFHVPGDLLGDALQRPGARNEWLDPTQTDAALPDWLAAGMATLFRGGTRAPDWDMDGLADAAGVATDARPPVAAPVVIVTGPAGAGKSTVARELCRRFPRSAHVEVDLLRHMVRSGFASPIPGESDPGEAERQIHLAAQNAVDLARTFSLAGFVAVVDDVIETRELLDLMLGTLGPDVDVRVVTLLPDADALMLRDAERPPGDRMGDRCRELREIIGRNGETRGLRLDTSAWDADRTVDVVLQRFDEAQVPMT